MVSEITKKNEFVENLNLLNGKIIFNSFDIDETIPFEGQWYSYDEDILFIKFGDRFALDVGWYPSGNPDGMFRVSVILDNNWDNPIAEIKAHNLTELKKVIEKLAKLINDMAKIKDIPYHGVQYYEIDMLTELNKTFIEKLNILDGKITYNCFNKGNALKEQLESLYDAILRIEFGQRFIMDIDWRSNVDSNSTGNFVVRTIVDKDWGNPLSQINCPTIPELKNAIERTAIFIKKMMKIKDFPYREPKHYEIEEHQTIISSFIQSLHITDGKIIRDNLNIDESVSLKDQINLLHNKLLEIEWNNRFLLNVGWHPEKDLDGSFIVQVIKDRDWGDPVFRIKCCTVASLKRVIIQAIEIINKINR
jgi:hypothetical protein